MLYPSNKNDAFNYLSYAVSQQICGQTVTSVNFYAYLCS